MTAIIRSEGIVLRRRDFRETSRTVVAFTRDAGKVQLLAKGARDAKSKFGAALEPLTRAEFVFYWRENKELFTLAEATPTWRPRHLTDNPTSLTFALAMAEATDKMTGEGDIDAALYGELARALEALDAGAEGRLALGQFLLKLARRAGLAPEVGKCARCGKPRPAGARAFVGKDAAILCGRCARQTGGAEPMEGITCDAVVALMEQDPSAARSYPRGTGERVLEFVRAHLRYHASLELKTLIYANP